LVSKEPILAVVLAKLDQASTRSMETTLLEEQAIQGVG
jgi:hypothetical protein